MYLLGCQSANSVDIVYVLPDREVATDEDKLDKQASQGRKLIRM